MEVIRNIGHSCLTYLAVHFLKHSHAKKLSDILLPKPNSLRDRGRDRFRATISKSVA